MTLDQLRPGEVGVVEALALREARAAPLRRLGLLPGTAVLCRRRSPFGDPTVYRFRETDVALRRRDAAGITLGGGRRDGGGGAGWA